MTQKTDEKPQLDPKYVKEIDGRQFVLYAGLLDLANRVGMKRLEVEILQYPNEDRGAVCKSITELIDGRVGIDVGHFGRLTAKKCAFVMYAGAGDPLHHLFDGFGFKLSCGEIVHEKQRAGPLYKNVVNAVVNDIFSDSIVLIEEKRDLEFCAHPVDAGNKDWIRGETFCGKETAKTTDPSQDLRAVGSLNGGCDPLFGFVGG